MKAGTLSAVDPPKREELKGVIRGYLAFHMRESSSAQHGAPGAQEKAVGC